MPKKSFFPAFLIFIFLAILIFVLGKSGVLAGPSDFIAKIVSPLQRATFSLSSTTQVDSKLSAENKNLVLRLAQFQKITAENSALRDQFETPYPQSQNLLPAKVLSAPSFVPGVSSPEYLVIDRGSNDGVKVGSAVVFKDNLVGSVTQVSKTLSKVMLVSNASTSFSARTVSVKGAVGTGALGIIKGDGGESMILDKVLLSDTLQPGDYVTTKGDIQIDNTGFPSSLIVGKITSVEKKSSDLFQRAKIRSLIDFSRLNIVFIVQNNQ